MLKHIPLSFYFEEHYTYQEVIDEHTKKLEQYFTRNGKKYPDRCVKGYIGYELDYSFDECGMERLVMLIAGILFCIKTGGIPEGDPEGLAYTAWYDLQDFCTGNYYDLFTPEDLVQIKQDVKFLLDYYDEHPALKGD